ncbi:site-2 protease family protein [Candidatus Berkelbacteria bacterium]|nr:site-2 protease family protein [Candidatus Berkelbacteria bacterium]
MLWQLLRSPFEFAGLLLALVTAISWHEAAHALMAHRLGDDTPKLAGRLTLNPLAHLDPIGSLFLLIFGFGWGKPVPVNSTKFANPALDEFKVAIAGPLSNIVLAVVFGLSLRLLGSAVSQNIFELLSVFVFINLVLAIFNFLPIPPLDGSKLLRLVVPFEVYLMIEQLGFPILVGLLLLSAVGIPIFNSAVLGPTTILFQLITGIQPAF